MRSTLHALGSDVLVGKMGSSLPQGHAELMPFPEGCIAGLGQEGTRSGLRPQRERGWLGLGGAMEGQRSGHYCIQ